MRFIVSIFLFATSCTIGGNSGAPKRKGEAKTAKAFLADSEEKLRKLQNSAYRAEWVNANFITDDTTKLNAEIGAQWTELATQIAKDSKKYTGKSENEKRQLGQYFLNITVPGPSNSKQNEELAQLKGELGSMYGSGKYCDDNGKCQSLEELSATIENSRDPKVLLEAWTQWRTVSVPMKAKYKKSVELGNVGAKELGFKNLADFWKSKYDMPPEDFEKLADELWGQVQPFYEQLHCYVRGQLNKKYGDNVVSKEGPIPAHLLGNMWGQSWANLTDLMDTGSGSKIDLTKLLKNANYDSQKMVKTAENFFVSLGMPNLPPTFYERSLFEKPKDREVVCHASAWEMDGDDDVRIKMCIKPDDENFRTIHHELGHIYYYLAYQDLPLPFQNSANDGFHEAMGDTLELSMTAKYLKDLGLLDRNAKSSGEIPYLMKMALGKIAFLPFGLMVDKWRWKVFSGEVPSADYNKAWWELRRKYQGLASPVERPEDAFDPGAKYHIPGYTPYSRYFLSHILQFQFHRSLCKTAGFEGPLHECSIYGSKEAGERIWKMMGMGSSKPWPEALEAVSGSPKMDASAIRDYFAPLEKWLVAKNQGMKCGW